MRPIEKVNSSGMLEFHDDHFAFCTNSRQTQLYLQAANHVTVLAIEASIQSATKSKSASPASFHMSAFPAKPMEIPKAVLGIRSRIQSVRLEQFGDDIFLSTCK